MRRNIFVFLREIISGDESEAEQDEKDDQNETAFDETTNSVPLGRRFDPR
jgi:hypothetical protein